MVPAGTEQRLDDQAGDQQHRGNAARQQPGLAEDELAQRLHRASTRAWVCETITNIATSSSSAASPPGQCTCRPSPAKNSPKDDSITPTPHFSSVSGSREIGWRSTT